MKNKTESITLDAESFVLKVQTSYVVEKKKPQRTRARYGGEMKGVTVDIETEIDDGFNQLIDTQITHTLSLMDVASAQSVTLHLSDSDIIDLYSALAKAIRRNGMMV